MKRVSLSYARKNLEKLVDAAERGESTIITRRGRPCAMIVPVPSEALTIATSSAPREVTSPDSHAKLLSALDALSSATRELREAARGDLGGVEVALDVEPDLRAWLEARARSEGLSVSDVAVDILRRSVSIREHAPTRAEGAGARAAKTKRRRRR